MDADLDTLATALYARTDDLLKAFPEYAPWRPAVGLRPRISDAELLTLAVLQGLLGFASESRWLRHARARLRYLFPCLPGQSGYNKRLRKLAATMTWLIRTLAADTSLWHDDVRVVDSTPVECGRSRETAHRSDLAGWAQYGYCASHSRWFWGLRLHLLGRRDLRGRAGVACLAGVGAAGDGAERRAAGRDRGGGQGARPAGQVARLADGRRCGDRGGDQRGAQRRAARRGDRGAVREPAGGGVPVVRLAV